MRKENFWEIIQRTIDNYTGTKESYIEELSYQLEGLTRSELARWDNYLSAYLELANQEKIWAGAFVLNKGDCSDDQFDSFRGWLISMGEDYYREILGNVDNLADLVVARQAVYTAKFEEILYLGQEVFIAKTFREEDSQGLAAENCYFSYLEAQKLDEEEREDISSNVTYDRKISIQWDETTLKYVKKELPKLFAKYWSNMDKDAIKWEVVIAGDDK